MRPLLVVLGALLVVSACAGIPSAGPVTKVEDDGGFGESTVRYSPARPAKDASPQQVVRGYLDAMLAYPASTGTAEAFLTPEAGKEWSPAAGVRVYSSPVVTPALAGGAQDRVERNQPTVDVQLGLTEDARLDRQGHYSRRARPATLTYRLQRVEGQWRITNPQAGLLVNRKFFDDYYRPFDIYYFDPPGRRIVPDPIYLVVGDQLATGLITSLARGPGRSTSGAARTYVPSLDSLRPSVPVSEDGLADVEFSTDFSAMSGAVQDHLSAQIVWTLRQVPDVEAVRLAGAATVLSSSGGAPQSVSSWGEYGPSAASSRAYALRGDRVVQIDDDTIKAISGPWGRDARGAVAIGVSEDGVAAVLPGRTAVRVTNREGKDARTFGGSRFIAPQWDADGGAWLVDRQGSGTRVRLVTADRIRTLDVGALAGLEVSSFALSPDGARYAVTVQGSSGASIRFGWVKRNGRDRVVGLGDPVQIHTPAPSPRSVSWSSGTGLSYLGQTQSGRQVYTTAIDGSSTSGGLSRGGALLPDVGARELAIGTGPTANRYALDARSRLWFLAPGGSWRLLGGAKVTGLTFGR